MKKGDCHLFGVGMKKTALLFVFALVVVFGVGAQQAEDLLEAKLKDKEDVS